MKLLILGGTRFLGRHLAEQALARGHELTLLHRGISGPALFPAARHLIADRDADLTPLADGHWDAVIDTSAYVPRQVRQAAAVLTGKVGHYQLVSTISVYADFSAVSQGQGQGHGQGRGQGRDQGQGQGRGRTAEHAALITLQDPSTEVVDGSTYGGLKVLCEAAARAGFGERCLIDRPGLLVGPHDPTGRFTWWPQRLQRGGDVLVPGRPEDAVQFIDARDAAAWMLLQSERQTQGVFNLTGPAQPLSMGKLMSTLQAQLNPAARLHWVDEDFLLQQQVAPWTELPLWLPRDKAGLHRTDIGAALASGLHCRPLAQTVLDTAAWAQAAAMQTTAPGGPPRPEVGLSAEREASLLSDWWRSRATG